MSRFEKITIVDGTTKKEAAVETNGALAVNIQDQHSHLVGSLFAQAKGSPMTLSTPTTVNLYTIEMTPGHTFIAGDEILIVEGDYSFHSKVTNVSVDTLTVNAPLDTIFTTSAIVFEIISNLNVDGSVTVQTFSIELGSGASISLDITGVRFVITDGVIMDDGKFGGISALTKGIVFRVVHTDGTHNLWTAKTNGKLGLIMNNKEYTVKAPAGEYSMNATWEISKDLGVTLRLDPGDKMEILIQDDLTALSTFKVWAYGHYVTD